MSFSKKMLTGKSYTTSKALLTTKQVQIVDSKKFVIAIMDIDSETFVIYMAIWEQEEIPIHSEK